MLPKIKVTLIIILLFTSLIPVASYGDCGSVASDTTNIYFVNGVLTSYANAGLAAELLRQAYASDLTIDYPEDIFEFGFAYNFSIDAVTDVLEVITQKIAELSDNDPSINQLTAEQYLNLFMTAREYEDLVPAPMAIAIEEAIALRYTNAVTAESHIQKYQTDLQEGRRVLLIAHSQGNLFANQALSALMAQYGSSIGMIGVASPAAFTVNNATYYTAHDDRVINALRFIATVLPSNIDNDPGIFNDPRDLSNHYFEKSYFAPGLLSRTLIDQDIYLNIENLQYPAIQLGSGAITVTLTWGDEPDVDLHVFEPNGTHVYYSNMIGPSGYLDLDDVDSYGPEHYYVACETLEEGDYIVGVNYYNGTGPETALVQISTADGNTRSFSQPLSTVMGSHGNSSPIIIATITINADGNGGYTYIVNQ